MRDKDKANIGLIELILDKFQKDKGKRVGEAVQASLVAISKVDYSDPVLEEALEKQDSEFSRKGSKAGKNFRKFNAGEKNAFLKKQKQ